MIKRFCKNSKKGLTLPVAIVISIVLVIVASGLIFIALSSVSTTSVTVNGRQAFLNLRSALEYVESYYRNQSQPNFAMIGDGSGIEYFSARNTSVSATDTTAVVKYEKTSTSPNLNDPNDPDPVRTYVIAMYVPAEGNEPARLKLTGYSFYADEFGNQGRSATMSVTFTIGSSNSQRRVTVIDRQEKMQYNNATDSIKLNLKMPIGLTNNPDPNKNWKLCYYVWSYTDAGHAYDDYGNDSYYHNGVRVKPDKDKLNTSEHNNNKYENNEWKGVDENGVGGAQGQMVGQANNWYSGDYKITAGRVNYFNVIFTSQGKALENGNNAELKIYNTQLNEIFHLWYLFPDDKNVFFEFFNNPKTGSPSDDPYYTKFFVGTGWNGKDGLDKTMLVYLRNQKTTVHFRALNDNKNAYKNVISSLNDNPPTISHIDNSDGTYTSLPYSFLSSRGVDIECDKLKQTSGIKMTYEGCGWWVANIETKKTFDISITYKGVEYSLGGIRPIASLSTPDAVPEAWLILNQRATNSSASEKYLEARTSEKTALQALGESTTSYVTVHAKNYEPDKNTGPVLDYDVKELDSTEGRNRLYTKIMEVQVRDSSRYENYDSLFRTNNLLKLSKEAYESDTFVNKPLRLTYDEATGKYGSTELEQIADTAEDRLTTMVERADQEYDKYVDKLNEALENLILKYASQETITSFRNLLSRAKTDYYDHNPLFDNDKYVTFKSVYNTAAAVNPKDGEKAFEDAIFKAMQKLINWMNILDANKVDRMPLASLMDVIYQGNYLNDEKYDAAKREELRKLIQDGNRSVIKLVDNNTVTTQAELDEMEDKVNSVWSAVKLSDTPPNVITSTLDYFITQAENKLSATTNYTDASRSQLETALNTAQSTRNNTSATQAQIDTAARDLSLAVYRFEVIKPGEKEDVHSSVASEKTRIWFNTDSGYSVNVKKVNDAGKIVEDVTKYVDATGYTGGTAAELSCITLTDATTTKIKLVINKVNADGTETEAFASEAYSIDQMKEKDYFDIDYSQSKVSLSKSTVLFIARKVDNKNIGTNIHVKIGSAELKKATSANYYIFRFPVSSDNVTVSVLGKDYGSVGKFGSGEYVIWLNGDNAVKVGIDQIYPVTPAEIPDTEPAAGGTIARADDSYEIRQVSISSDTADEVFKAVRDSSGELDNEHMYIVFRSRGVIQDNYKIYSFGDGDNQKYPGTAFTGNVTVDGEKYYYYRAKKVWNKFIVNNGQEGDPNKVDGLGRKGNSYKEDYVLLRDENAEMYDYYLIEKDRNTNNYSVNQRKHKGYEHDLTDAEIQARFSNLAEDMCVVFLQTRDDPVYEFGTPLIHIWSSTGAESWTNGTPKEMNLDSVYAGWYFIEFPKTYDSVNIKSGKNNGVIADTTLSPSGADWYIIERGSSNDSPANVVRSGNITRGTGVNPTDPTDATKLEEVSVSLTEDMASVLLLNVNGIVGSAPYIQRLTKNQNPMSDVEVGNGWDSMNAYQGPDTEHSDKYNDYFYMPLSDECVRFSVAKGEGGADIIKENIDLPKNPYTKGLYKYYIVSIVSKGSSYEVWFDYYGDNKPRYEFAGSSYNDTGTAEVKLAYPDIKMAYVGGGKIRVKNSSYYYDYSSGKKNTAHSVDISSSNLFGGSGDNQESFNRIGNSKLLPYYDWYEYKIPVNAVEKYDFCIYGLDPENKGWRTRTVKNAYGDVWVSLFNRDSSDGVFTKAELSTFDIDVYQVPEKMTLYFKLPTGWSSVGTSHVSKAHGIAYDTGSSTIDFEAAGKGTFEQIGRRTNIYRVEGISKYTPFITVKYQLSGENEKEYNIRLQGGTKILFNPNANGGLGGWEDFVSDQDDLKSVCQNLLDLYAAKTIVSGYDSEGNIKTGAQFHKSKYVTQIFDGDTDCFTKDGSKNYQVNTTVINGLDESVAYNKANALRKEYDNLNTLYVLMSQARAHISTPLRNGDGSGTDYHSDMEATSKYPEYLAGGGRVEYENIDTLKTKLKEAETVYLSEPTALDTSKVEDAINELNRAIVNLKVKTSGVVAVVLYDVQERVKNGHRLQLHYYNTKEKTTPVQKKDISFDTDLNSEGYPIVFIDKPAGGKIYHVQFYDVTEQVMIGTEKKVMAVDEAWVYMDYAVNGLWRENSLTDFRDIVADEYRQSKTTDDSNNVTLHGVEFIMDKTPKTGGDYTYKDMTLYFKYDTKIVDASGSLYYTIKSGAYTFTAGNVNKLAAPLKLSGDDVLVDLFDPKAKEYFTTSDNYKMYTKNASDGKSVLWWSNGEFSTTSRSVLGININLDVSKGSFAGLRFTQNYSFSTDKGIYFRWSSPDPLYVGGAGVKMYAGEYRLGSVGGIDGVTYGDNGTHFYLYNYDSSADKMNISVLNDITVSYLDSMNKTHSFVIREGDYEIRKAYKKNASGAVTTEQTDYIADLFDEAYWKNFEYVTPLEGGTDTTNWVRGNTGLSNPVYG